MIQKHVEKGKEWEIPMILVDSPHEEIDDLQILKKLDEKKNNFGYLKVFK